LLPGGLCDQPLDAFASVLQANMNVNLKIYGCIESHLQILAGLIEKADAKVRRHPSLVTQTVLLQRVV